MSNLEQSDKEAAAVAVAERVTLDDIKNSVAFIGFCSGADFFGDAIDTKEVRSYEASQLLTLCLLVTKNGFTVVGTSACASPENFNAEFGRNLAYEDALRQIWPLMGYALRDKLHKQSQE